MKIEEYRDMVVKTENGSLKNYPVILHAVMGMNGEAGECIDLIKKTLFQGHEFDEEHFLNELGDICWYTILLADKMELDLYYINNTIDKFDELELMYDIVESKGLDYILDINKQCGNIVEIFKGYTNSKLSSKIKGSRMVRSILYDIDHVAKIFGKTLEDIFDINKLKIKTRYPDGFNTDSSVNRSDNY